MEGLYTEKSNIKDYDLFLDYVKKDYPSAIVETGKFKNNDGTYIADGKELVVLRETGVASETSLQYARINVKTDEGTVEPTDYLSIDGYNEGINTVGNEDTPYTLVKDDDNTPKITEIDLNGCYASFGTSGMFSDGSITSFTNGTIVNENGSGFFSGCTSLTEFNCALPNLTEGNGMFVGCPITSWTVELPNLTNAQGMLQKTSLESFEVDLPSLTLGTSMFSECASLKTVKSNMPKLEQPSAMFSGCTELTEFSGCLSSVTNGQGMFAGKTKLSSVSTDLRSLKEGSSMFAGCTSLSEFTGNLDSLENVQGMFYGCPLTTWSVDLPSLTNASGFFSGCTTLKTFGHYEDGFSMINLDNVVNASGMFSGCTSLGTGNYFNIWVNLPKATNITYAFQNCTGFTGKATLNLMVGSITDASQIANMLKGVPTDATITIFAPNVETTKLYQTIFTPANMGWEGTSIGFSPIEDE